jgi:integrase/recombinase XerD
MTTASRTPSCSSTCPVANVRRPKVSDDSSTVGLTAEELDRLLTAAEAHGPRSAALVSLLVYNGLRIAEILGCDIEHFSHQRGHRVLRITRKGGTASTEPVAPIVLHALELYASDRTSGPIFLNADGTDRLSYSTSYALIRRLARGACIAGAARISPHSLRHSFATELLASGVPLQDPGRYGARRPTHHSRLRPLTSQPRPTSHLHHGSPVTPHGTFYASRRRRGIKA